MCFVKLQVREIVPSSLANNHFRRLLSANTEVVIGKGTPLGGLYGMGCRCAPRARDVQLAD